MFTKELRLACKSEKVTMIDTASKKRNATVSTIVEVTKVRLQTYCKPKIF
jgi:hypothetical protein